MKRKICIVLAVIVLISALGACTAQQPDEEKTTASTTEKTTTTTTETTTTTTTEDLSTTFPETQTNYIYKGLKKGDPDEFPYELATYTTYYNAYEETRTANLNNAASKINKLVIPEDRYFSFNQNVGKRTVTAGFQTAKIIRGDEFVDGLGGGVCQVSSTIFECVLRANVEIVDRSAHSLKISYVPLGGDATVQWNSQDFVWKNTTGTDVMLRMYTESGKLVCTLYGKSKVNVGDVDISIKRNGNSYTLTRTVNGTQNYQTYSTYKEQVTTTKKKSDKKKDEKNEKNNKKNDKKDDDD